MFFSDTSVRCSLRSCRALFKCHLSLRPPYLWLAFLHLGTPDTISELCLGPSVIIKSQTKNRSVENMAQNRLGKRTCLQYESWNKEEHLSIHSQLGIGQLKFFCRSVHVCKWPKQHFVSSALWGYKYIFVSRWLHKYGINNEDQSY